MMCAHDLRCHGYRRKHSWLAALSSAAGGSLASPLQGRINKGDIDARMLKALADLPVDLGIEAIDKFAMASLDSIRSKTGFMVGSSLPLLKGLV